MLTKLVNSFYQNELVGTVDLESARNRFGTLNYTQVLHKNLMAPEGGDEAKELCASKSESSLTW